MNLPLSFGTYYANVLNPSSGGLGRVLTGHEVHMDYARPAFPVPRSNFMILAQGLAVTSYSNTHLPFDIYYAPNAPRIREAAATAPLSDYELRSMTRNSGDTAAQPLIYNGREDAAYDEHDDDVEVDESELVSPGLFIWTLTVCAGVSGLLFGYEYVATSSIFPPHSDPYKPT